MRFFLGLILLLIIALETGMVLFNIYPTAEKRNPIKVGLIFSLSGPRSYKEFPVQKATLLAIHEINQQGGIFGRQILPIVRDSQSIWEVTQEKVEELVNIEQVEVLFGCWAPNELLLKELLEKYGNLLISPYQYVGILSSPHIISVGTSANQQVLPTVHYCQKHFGKRFYLVGAQTIYSRLLNVMIKDQVIATNGEIVEEIYLSEGSQQIDNIVKTIQEKKPNVILNSLNIEESEKLFKKLRNTGIKPSDIPIVSFTISELALQEMNIQEAVGDYATWNYFQSLDTPANLNFVNNFKKFSHLDFVDNCAEASYCAVYLWRQAVNEAGSTHWKALDKIFDDLRIQTPDGSVIMSMNGLHAWKYVRIGKIRENRQFEIVWSSEQPVRPLPYQTYRSKTEWESLALSLQHQLNSSWMGKSGEEIHD